ncbi:unnamed protein product, partial [Laminaria digitata]
KNEQRDRQEQEHHSDRKTSVLDRRRSCARAKTARYSSPVSLVGRDQALRVHTAVYVWGGSLNITASTFISKTASVSYELHREHCRHNHRKQSPKQAVKHPYQTTKRD